jgi:hypothetical protein
MTTTTTIPAHYETHPWEPQGMRPIDGTERGNLVKIQIVGYDYAHGNVEWGVGVSLADPCGWQRLTAEELRQLHADCGAAIAEIDSLSDPEGTLAP